MLIYLKKNYISYIRVQEGHQNTVHNTCKIKHHTVFRGFISKNLLWCTLKLAEDFLVFFPIINSYRLCMYIKVIN